MAKIMIKIALLCIGLMAKYGSAISDNNNGRTKLGLSQIHPYLIKNGWPHWMPKKENQRLNYIHNKMRQAAAAGGPAAFHALDIDIDIDIDITITGAVNTPQKVALDPGESIGTANYVVHVELGSSSTPLTWILDTGSDLAWTQCKPCTACYYQADPVFDPANSATYRAVECGTAVCKSLGDFAAGCDNASNTCQYAIRYGDGSNTTGDYFTDKLAFSGGSGAGFSDYPIGCGHVNRGLFNGSDGLIGFSLGELAFPRQTSTSSFAYCLSSPFSDTSDGYLEFPASDGSGDCSPLVTTTGTSFFILTLKSVGLNSKQLSGATSSYLFIVDSGTVVTRLPSDLYGQVKTAFRNATAMFPDADGDGFFDACFTVPANVTSVDVPSVSLNFDGNATFTPTEDGLLIPLGNSVYCLAYVSMPSGANYGILGNFQQQAYELTFDVQGSKICFGSSNSC